MRGGASGGCGRRRRTNHVERERLETRWGCQPMNSSNQSRWKTERERGGGGRHFTWSSLKVGLMRWYDQVSLFETYAFGYKWIRPPAVSVFFLFVCSLNYIVVCLSWSIYRWSTNLVMSLQQLKQTESLWDFNFTGLLFNIQLFHRLLLFYGKLWHLYDSRRFNLITRSLLIKLPRNAVKINLPVTLNGKVLLPCLRTAVITSARSTLLTFDTLEILKWLYL